MCYFVYASIQHARSKYLKMCDCKAELVELGMSLVSALSTICWLAPFSRAETDGVLVITPAVWSALGAIVRGTMANQGLQKGGMTCMNEGRRRG